MRKFLARLNRVDYGAMVLGLAWVIAWCVIACKNHPAGAALMSYLGM